MELGLWIALAPSLAHAGPRLALHPGGLGFDGPTEPQVTALWWNVAALGELPGTHLQLTLSPTFLSEQMDLSGAAPQHNVDLQPDLFAGFVTDFGLEHVRFGFGYHVPFRDRGSLAGSDTPTPADDGPLRYHRLRTFFRDHHFTAAGTYRINPSVSFGVGMNLVWSDAELIFDRCLALDQGPSDCSNPSADETVAVRGSSLTVGFQAGFLWRILGRLTMGGAFILRPGLSDITADDYSSGMRNARVTRLSNGQVVTQEGFGQIHYNLPDVVHLGFRWLATNRLEASVNFRYADWARRVGAMRIELRLPRGMTPPGALNPERILLYRGFQDAYGLRARGAYCVLPPHLPGERCGLRLGLEGGYDTGAYGAQAVSADALDGPTIDFGLLLEWRASPHVRVLGGANYAFLLAGSVDNSVYRPEFAVACTQARFALPQCAEANQGRGIPSANGQYRLDTFMATLGVALDWWPE